MTHDDTSKLICCGWDEVFVLDLAQEPPGKVWSWRAAERPELAAVADEFRTTDKCKPVDLQGTAAERSCDRPDGHSTHVLITSSSGGVAVVERGTRKAVFHTSVPNAHSAELLPGGRLAVASSGSWGWHQLLVYDLTGAGEPLWRDDLSWAHGVVWDEGRQLLWALGDTELRTYAPGTPDSTEPPLRRVDTFELPTRGGHDLVAVPNSHDLIVTTNEGVYVFDRNTGSFTPHPDLGGLPVVKGVAVHPTSGRIAYVQAEGGHWWSTHIHFLRPASELHLPDEHLYKVRWA